ncbi:MAG: hypothetical protein QOD07_2996 [Frankiaceae bacterium]|jgi:hypothetical protein|nr:hypothetical protein [Frankiaceae bacterium]
MRRRVRSAVSAALAPGDEIRAIARDAIGRDYWVLTDREILRFDGRRILQRLALNDTVGTITTQPSAGVTVRIHSRRTADTHMLTSFRKANDVTRGLAARFEHQPETE